METTTAQPRGGDERAARRRMKAAVEERVGAEGDSGLVREPFSVSPPRLVVMDASELIARVGDAAAAAAEAEATTPCAGGGG